MLLYNNLMKYWDDLLPNFVFNIKYENLISNTKKEINTANESIHRCLQKLQDMSYA